ncbi:putative FAD synthase [Tritrichomonas foetus]|uniref:FAD synthase n=1 Tax=Tritrichomonas foetus TaxID=1144522 RepID=A0A1J4JVZ7_9EUKA|nr:putative FAD synthase [Tritrichomonas foetus]|eukprot:OHT03313.1 putative FAD synthase [Tritrichomonas foetus]
MFSRFLDSFPKSLNSKIESSLGIIASAYEQYRKELGVCFNGGKDSVVLLDLVQRFHEENKCDFPMNSFFFKSPHEFPEMAEYVKNAENYWKQNFRVIESASLQQGLSTIVDKYGVNAIFLGVRQSDPKGGNLLPFTPTTEGWADAMRIFPLLEWEYSDIWEYLDVMKLPICDLYKRGYTSIGSPATTKPNPHLYDPLKGEYKHARELKDGSLERLGRL